ncbi:shiftless antiviral inhibitor of ribosomal frameshifting protein isoform X2 [Eublepharis macularius]|uniref:Shiftless antiviral inhibitor of ribosomal frameshifting protein isoform X2 n=1 Tax=Eublepharis macularius TaxID=481883 RepID=A0AA97LKY5_EUBMA|nr:shiftless antiviral inhibitor of ribosomal frameshifting protein isoform X2 [Eublepharis macularius]
MQRVGQEEVELEKSVRRLREKFYGKVTIKDAVILMRTFTNNHDIACKRIILFKNQMEDTDTEDEERLADDPVALVMPHLFVLCRGWKKVINKLKKEEEEMKQKPKNDPQNEKKIEEVARQLKVLPLTERNVRMFNNAQNNLIPPSDCQFSCQPCDSMWWRRVPKRKQVSRCRLCGTRYDPVPADKMWGTGEFHCSSCGRTFKGLAQMGIPSPCYICRTPVYPSHIIPPRRTPGQRSRQPHSCFAEDCYNRKEPHVPGTHCVHPRSRVRNGLPKVIHPCQKHVSTGSTVATCLSQGSLALYDIDELILEDLQELDGDAESSS